MAIADDQTRRFVQQRLKIGTEDERRLGMAAVLNSFEMLSHDEKGSSVLQGMNIRCKGNIINITTPNNLMYHVPCCQISLQSEVMK